MFRDQSGATAFQMWSDKEESESGESDSLLWKSSLFRGVLSVFSLPRPLPVLPSALGFANHQFLVPSACSSVICSQLISFGCLPDS